MNLAELALGGHAPEAELALAAAGAPQHDDLVAGGDARDALADRLNDAGTLVAEHDRCLRVQATRQVVNVAVADACSLDAYLNLAGPGRIQVQVFKYERGTRLMHHHRPHLGASLLN